MEKLYDYKYKGTFKGVRWTKEKLQEHIKKYCGYGNNPEDYEIFELKSLGTPKLVTTVEF